MTAECAFTLQQATSWRDSAAVVFGHSVKASKEWLADRTEHAYTIRPHYHSHDICNRANKGEQAGTCHQLKLGQNLPAEKSPACMPISSQSLVNFNLSYACRF